MADASAGSPRSNWRTSSLFAFGLHRLGNGAASEEDIVPVVGVPPVFHDHVRAPRGARRTSPGQTRFRRAARGARLGRSPAGRAGASARARGAAGGGPAWGEPLDVGQGVAWAVGRGLREGEELPIRCAAGARGLGRQVLDRDGPPLGALEVAAIGGESREVLA